MNTEFHLVNEFCSFLINLIRWFRDKVMNWEIRTKLKNISSEFFYIKPNGFNRYDIKNLSLPNLIQLNHALKYLSELQPGHDFIVDVLIDKTDDLIWKADV